MWVGLSEAWRVVEQHWVCAPVTLGLGGAVWVQRLREQVRAEERRRDRRIREEIEAYAHLDARLPSDGNVRLLSRTVCDVVVEKSPFRRAAMLARDAEGRLYVAGSAGMDDVTKAALHQWGERVVVKEREGGDGAKRGDGGVGVPVGTKSFAVVLGASQRSAGCGRVIVFPLRHTCGRMVGALVVGADTMMSLPRRVVFDAVGPLEALSVKLGRSMENAALAERLLRTEKLAGLGLLAGGVAHALNNPLTAVLGFAELIAETTEEPRVQEDAATIICEALRMRETVERLLNFWRPSVQREEKVELSGLLRELALACEKKLKDRGVRLVVQVGEDVPAVRGNGDRLRQVMEHLLNNAAQAIATSSRKDKGLEAAIRISVGHDDRGVQVIVSDTGPGFREPGRAFDPFYTTREPGEGTGLGLSICYGIVREHGGEISAFNLHPHGAAVVVELPFGEKKNGEYEAVVREVA
ncbi:MAG TPA: HAMP domain-containing sensor histidine kinase [Edaphobacter sp.]|nr:HAMP domain-containing sensor histidine kinase [Edaphobacter sp.]